MNNTRVLVEGALHAWKTNVDRNSKFFLALSEDQLQEEIAPGRNRAVYLFGHHTAINDMLLPLLRVGPRLHPELDTMFVVNPDGAKPITVSTSELKLFWAEVNETLWREMNKLSPEEWLERHGSVSEEEFAREPYRNRHAVLLSRTSHLAYHFGQAILIRPR